MRDRVSLYPDGPEGGSPSEAVHDGKADAFRRDHFAENHVHALLVQPAQDVKEPVGDFGR